MYVAEIVADSLSPDDWRLTTMRLRFPRFVLAELNTHRVFSRNAASSRAISIQTRIDEVMTDPVLPHEWGAASRSMAATEMIAPELALKASSAWLSARDAAIDAATAMHRLGVHKQVVNRLLEPFAWVDVILSGTDWTSFFALRCAPEAQPEIRHLACLMREAYEASLPRFCQYGTWHIPLLSEEELDTIPSFQDALLIAAGRIARVSYNGRSKTIEADLELAHRLRASGHWSPFEHVAVASPGQYVMCRNYQRGWHQLRAMLDND